MARMTRKLKTSKAGPPSAPVGVGTGAGLAGALAAFGAAVAAAAASKTPEAIAAVVTAGAMLGTVVVMRFRQAARLLEHYGIRLPWGDGEDSKVDGSDDPGDDPEPPTGPDPDAGLDDLDGLPARDLAVERLGTIGHTSLGATGSGPEAVR